MDIHGKFRNNLAYHKKNALLSLILDVRLAIQMRGMKKEMEIMDDC